MRKLLPLILITIFVVSNCNALECYVCDNQEENEEKCLKTIITCEQNEDVCATDIEWKTTPYWTISAIKQLYVSKSCMPKLACLSKMKEKMRQTGKKCDYLGYQDWECTDCCQGDRCNYYVISSASHYKISFVSMVLLSALGYLLAR